MLIWGTTFITTAFLVQGNSPALPPSMATLGRFVVASLVFLPFAWPWTWPRKMLLPAAELSFWLWAGYATQAAGLQYTSVPRSAFVTALNVVFVPVFTAMAGRRVGAEVWVAVVLAIVGVGVMTFDPGDPTLGASPNLGDWLTLGCALTYGFYIFRLERLANAFPSTALTAAQLVGVAALCVPWMLIESTVGQAGWGRWDAIVVVSLLYMGVVATLVTTWLQAMGQRWVPGTHASLLYTMEPVAASLCAMFFGVSLTPRAIVGGSIILLAAGGSQVPAVLRLRKSRRRAAVGASAASEVDRAGDQ